MGIQKLIFITNFWLPVIRNSIWTKLSYNFIHYLFYNIKTWAKRRLKLLNLYKTLFKEMWLSVNVKRVWSKKPWRSPYYVGKNYYLSYMMKRRVNSSSTKVQTNLVLIKLVIYKRHTVIMTILNTIIIFNMMSCAPAK